MSELNREKIIKALGMCIASRPKCKECPYFIGDIRCKHSKLLKDALSLIKELTEENERLRAEKETLEIYNKDYKYKNKELTAFNRRWAKECAELQDECDQIKGDTVRKMEDLFDKYFCHDPAFLGVEQRLIMAIIDRIAKETLEDST